MIVTRPYNVDVGQTIGTVTSVQHSWHGSAARLSGQEEGRFGTPEDPEKTLAGNEGKVADPHVGARGASMQFGAERGLCD